MVTYRTMHPFTKNSILVDLIHYGVIMIEAAAQLSSIFVKKVYGLKGFIGFAGIESAKFRIPVEPGQRLYLLAHITKFKRRIYTCSVQGLVNDKMVFETVVSGLNV